MRELRSRSSNPFIGRPRNDSGKSSLRPLDQGRNRAPDHRRPFNRIAYRVTHKDVTLLNARRPVRWHGDEDLDQTSNATAG